VYIRNYSVLHLLTCGILSDYGESAKFISCFAPACLFVSNQPTQARIANGLLKSPQFNSGAFDSQFHPTVKQVTHRPSQLITGREGFHGIAESDSLHMSAVQNLQTVPFHKTSSWLSRTVEDRLNAIAPVFDAGLCGFTTG
jgi:hypothetical protein